MENYTKMGLNKPIEWKELTEEEKVELFIVIERRVREDRKKDMRAGVISLFLTVLILIVSAALFRWLWM